MMGATYDEALATAETYFGNDLSARVFIDKYALRDGEGQYVETTPDQMHDRLATEFARIDAEKYGADFQSSFDEIRGALEQFARIVPQGSPMAAIGNKYQNMSASNCVVVDSPHDSIAGIMKSGTDLAQLMKRRCGVGIDISTLRPTGASVNNAARTTSGAWSFADFFSYVTRMIGQEGRRGALMVTMDVHHPDIERFAVMKHDLTKVTGANVSVRISDEFLKAVEDDAEYEQRWPAENPEITRMVRARDVWDLIVSEATNNAEPGLIMWDNMVNNLPLHCYPDFFTISTNPCSEIALSAYDSCRLISINLTGYVKNPFALEEDAEFNWALFKSDVRLAVRMADNLIDLELELIEKIKSLCDGEEERKLWQKLWDAGHKGRRTGLGTHGLADMLSQMQLRYDSTEALEFLDKLYRVFRDVAYEASIDLAAARGAFPVYDNELEKNCDFIKRLPKRLRVKMAKHGRRNGALLTQAPTGSVSQVSRVGNSRMFGVSSGVEPVFRNYYTRRKKITGADQDHARVDFVDALGDKWQEFKVYHKNVEYYLDVWGSDGVSATGDLPEYFVTSDEIDWEKRVELQGVEQQYIDHSISSTINLPRGTSEKMVGDLYLQAWRKGLKGVTVYVDGSRDGVLITEENAQLDEDGRPMDIIPSHAPKRLDAMPCEIHHAQIKGTRWTILIGLLKDQPYEIFIGHSDNLSLPNKCKFGKILKRKKGWYDLHVDVGGEDLIIKNISKTFSNSEAAWATRIISVALRHGTPVDFLVEQLQKDGTLGDINRVISRLLKKYIKDGQQVRSSQQCTNCGSSNLVYEEGCLRCLDCGNGKCG